MTHIESKKGEQVSELSDDIVLFAYLLLFGGQNNRFGVLGQSPHSRVQYSQGI